ncbi:MAG: IPExxxVDY family protein [Bacteroidales bacterium]|nr:IPExxxVDY family protein [Bacteroidales bacterium]
MKPGNPIRKKTLKLKVNEDIHFRLIGISSHENDYRLVWAINNKLGFQFTRTESLFIHRAALKTDLEFSRFTYIDEDRRLTYSWISNRCPDGFLFVEIRNFDFLVKITGEIREDETKEFVKKLKTVDVVSASFILEPEKLKGWRDILQE